MNERIRSRFEDAHEAAILITEWISGRTREDLDEDLMLEAALVRQFEIIGEALRVVRDFDEGQAERIPLVHDWIGMRHRLIHDYREVDLDLLWSAATVDILPLTQTLESILTT